MEGEFDPDRVTPILPLRVGNSAASAMPSLASAASTWAAAAAISRFSFCAVSSRGVSSVEPKFDHQPALGQIGADLSLGAVKAGGTSPGRFRAWGLSVQAVRPRASALALTPRKK